MTNAIQNPPERHPDKTAPASSSARVLLVDLGLFVVAALMVFTTETVLFFHLVFVLLSVGAFYWTFRGFVFRTIVWVGLTVAVVLRAIQVGTTQPDEIIEIPLLLTVLLTVFLIASRRAKTQRELEEHSEKLVKLEENLQQANYLLEQRVNELSDSTSELRKRNEELVRLNERDKYIARQLEALAQVTGSMAAIRNVNELLARISRLISDSFGFYHVGIFLLDELGEYAVLRASNSEGGKRMLARQHRLRVGEQGIVGTVTRTGEVRIAMDVGLDAVYFDNPDLRETHSEMALPLKAGGKIIGALDVQSTNSGAFTDDDIRMLSLLADQVSLAIENATLFDESSRLLSETEAISRQFIRNEWNRLLANQPVIGYQFNSSGSAPLTVAENAVNDGGETPKGDLDAQAGNLVLPIRLRGEEIGSLLVKAPPGDDFDAAQMNLINAVAERVALSMENARLFEETTRRAEREKLVSEITGKIRSVNDPQAMIQLAAEELKNVLGASRVQIVPRNGNDH